MASHGDVSIPTLVSGHVQANKGNYSDPDNSFTADIAVKAIGGYSGNGFLIVKPIFYILHH